MNVRTIRHYVGRINEENGEQAIMQYDSYSGTFRSAQGLAETNGYGDSSTVNRLALWLNNIDDELGGKFYYYRLDSDNRTNKVIPEDAPEEVLRWFRDDEEEPEEEPTE